MVVIDSYQEEKERKTTILLSFHFPNILNVMILFS
ncbi:hypothetical protein SGGBAA2069_c01290 [Streptococcus gallolyticus subsp. gallolyticus ATCC BAA-2069]|nr:hypothetical protein SGGBAA2069_c01290 [Streptococcus gallolyticus subsp. gallolyticus ATCC BAA-2069]